VKNRKFADRTRLVQIRAPKEFVTRIAGIRTQDPATIEPGSPRSLEEIGDDVVICRCEHVTAGEIREAIRSGVEDVNEMKATLRVCMGACCGKNCPEHIARLYREEGHDVAEITPATVRPLFLEVPFGVFAAGEGEGDSGAES